MYLAGVVLMLTVCSCDRCVAGSNFGSLVIFSIRGIKIDNLSGILLF